MAKNKSDSPFRNGTVEQVEAAEASSFYIVVGPKVFTYNTQVTFSKEDADFHYDKVREFLVEVIAEGNQKEKDEAAKTLSTLKIMPLRIN